MSLPGKRSRPLQTFSVDKLFDFAADVFFQDFFPGLLFSFRVGAYVTRKANLFFFLVFFVPAK